MSEEQSQVPKAGVSAWQISIRSRSRGREAPTASEASHASESRHARSEATRFVTESCTTQTEACT